MATNGHTSLNTDSTASVSSVPPVREDHKVSAAYVALLEMCWLPVALAWIVLTVGGIVSFHYSDLGALQIVPSVTYASVSTATALIQSESGVQSENGGPFAAHTVKVASALVLAAALLVLAAAVPNVRLLLCTVVSLLVCVSTSILPGPFAELTVVETWLAMVAVLSVAYSLYLLGHFRMALLDSRRATTVKEAVIVMVSKSNWVIGASGTTLAVSEVVMLVGQVPQDQYFEFFWYSLIPISLAIATSISFMPLMLILLPDFFSVVRDCGLSSQGCNFCSQRLSSVVSASDSRAVSEPATCVWLDILLVAVAMVAPVCFVCFI